jgi:hypothetical protein
MDSAELITSAELTFNLSNAGPISLVLNTNDPQSAQKLDQIFTSISKSYQEIETAKAQVFSASDDPIKKAYAAYLQRTAALWAASMRPERSGQSLVILRIEGGSPEQRFAAASVARIAMSASFQTEPSDAEAGLGGIDLGSMIQQMMGGAAPAFPGGEPGASMSLEISPTPSLDATPEQAAPQDSDPAMEQQAGQRRRGGNRRGRRGANQPESRGNDAGDGM